ncbi:FAD/NAD(P)-binding protein [Agrobacterium larrymoorei]|uniref:FAD/NAD(P)-binding domain-containing protein n=1 Tax=Agrobacterium larrymoorei TaxID=160699 RepID=A0AAF0HBQ2_9HYPH|nr:FAD/NAD(P)-binding protein [Agrobacterium larrymoorei]WHA43546.1 FAD/NAD(P)-binding domain-containing protein [Agrobacterium larrymoorei]
MTSFAPMSSARLTVAVVGGGFTGAAVAVHLLSGEEAPSHISVVVVEPRDELGRGLAYSATDPAHRINVPAGRMTLFPDIPDDFEAYLGSIPADDDAELLGQDGLPYPKRSVFGDYVSARIKPFLAEGRIEHWQTRAASITKVGHRYEIIGYDGARHFADIVVLAVSHPPPSLPRALHPFKDDPKLVHDVTSSGAIDAVGANDRVLIVGNGLTSADVVASLTRRGHLGRITSVSRRGLRSRGHGPAGQEPFGDFTSQPFNSSSKLLHHIRHLLREADAQGMTWHSVVDALRGQGKDIWKSLPVAERRRIARHVRPFWDVHRFRIAPQVEAAVEQAISRGQMNVLAASLSSVARSDTGYRVALRPKGSAILETLDVDAIVVTTGPAHGGILRSQPILVELEEAGVLQSCPTGLGIEVDALSNPISKTGESTPSLFIAGPLARGTFGELMGLPQVTEHAIFVAERIRLLVRQLDGRPDTVAAAAE